MRFNRRIKRTNIARTQIITLIVKPGELLSVLDVIERELVDVLVCVLVCVLVDGLVVFVFVEVVVLEADVALVEEGRVTVSLRSYVQSLVSKVIK